MKMPSFYADWTVSAGSDVPGPLVLTSVVQTLHRSGHAGEFALALPDMKGHLPGDRLRVFTAEESILQEIISMVRCSGAADLVRVTSVREVPEAITSWLRFASFKLDAPYKVARRLRRAKEKGGRVYTDNDIAAALSKNRALESEHPFFRLHSASRGDTFKLFIRRLQAQGPSKEGATANAYGFSSGAFISQADPDGKGQQSPVHGIVVPEL